jgi:hypothetical protein
MNLNQEHMTIAVAHELDRQRQNLELEFANSGEIKDEEKHGWKVFESVKSIALHESLRIVKMPVYYPAYTAEVIFGINPEFYIEGGKQKTRLYKNSVRITVSATKDGKRHQAIITMPDGVVSVLRYRPAAELFELIQKRSR